MKQTTETPDITSIEWKDLNPLEQHEMKRKDERVVSSNKEDK